MFTRVYFSFFLFFFFFFFLHASAFACAHNTGFQVMGRERKGGEEQEKKKNLDSSVAIMFYPRGICLSERGWSHQRRNDCFFLPSFSSARSWTPFRYGSRVITTELFPICLCWWNRLNAGDWSWTEQKQTDRGRAVKDSKRLCFDVGSESELIAKKSSSLIWLLLLLLLSGCQNGQCRIVSIAWTRWPWRFQWSIIVSSSISEYRSSNTWWTFAEDGIWISDFGEQQLESTAFTFDSGCFQSSVLAACNCSDERSSSARDETSFDWNVGSLVFLDQLFRLSDTWSPSSESQSSPW